MAKATGTDTDADGLGTELRDLNFHEISGVDSPANDMPGWLVMKSAESPDEISVALPEYGEDGLAIIEKAIDTGEWRYTLGPVYAPGMTDKHGEWTTDDEMHRGALRYQMQADRRLRLQHNEGRSVGTVLSVFRWPYEVPGAVLKAGAEKREVTLPAGTVFAEILWDERPWNELVKTGKVRGLSMGGRAKRVRVAVAKSVSDGDLEGMSKAEDDGLSDYERLTGEPEPTIEEYELVKAALVKRLNPLSGRGPNTSLTLTDP